MYVKTKLFLILMVAVCSCSLPQDPGAKSDEKNPGARIAEDRCSLAPDPGPCKANFTRYYYDATEKKCKEFVWGGCDGVVPFETLAECEKCKDN